MEKALDILASGVHDAKNQLLAGEARLAEAESRFGIDLGEARYAIEAAAERLTRALGAYRLLREGGQPVLLPVIVGDLCAEVALDQRHHLAAKGLTLEIDCRVPDEWPLDRDLVGDILNNAVQNAGRYARQRVRLSAEENADGLLLRVEDDGPGYAALPPPPGIGLLVASRLAELHRRRERHGRLELGSGGDLGGAVFALHLP